MMKEQVCIMLPSTNLLCQINWDNSFIWFVDARIANAKSDNIVAVFVVKKKSRLTLLKQEIRKFKEILVLSQNLQHYIEKLPIK